MSEAPMTVRAAMEAQARACDAIGSPLYGALLVGLVEDYDSGGVTAALLDGVTDRPQHDALPLRYLACAHRLALAGEAAELSRHYPSCGGAWDGSAGVIDAFLATVHADIDEFRAGVMRNVQTNEVGRAAVLASGFAVIARRYGLPIDQLEIGSSAGLLSMWDHYRYDAGLAIFGDPASELSFGPEWWIAPPPARAEDITVRSRRASDVSPIDVRTAAGRTTAMSFVWPDQLARFERLRAALDIGDRYPITVDRADAGDWLSEQLAGGPAPGAATVVFHSIVWQYLPKATRDRVRGAIRAAGASATDEAPLLWMRMEPATPAQADLRLMSFPNGDDEVLAEVGYHGADIRWLAR